MARPIAGSGRALELNIGGLIRPWIPQWWREEGGQALTIASDAHTPDWLAGNFYEAMAMAEHFGFHPPPSPGLLDSLMAVAAWAPGRAKHHHDRLA